MKARVVHIITKLELGGAQQNTLYTVSHLDKNNFDPILISGEAGILDEEAKKIDIEFIQVPSLIREVRPHKDFIAMVSLTRILREIKKREPKLPVIVHTHSSKAGILGRWAAFFARCDIIVHTYHGFGFTDWQSPLVRLAFVMAERISRPITNAFICVSKNNMEVGEKEKILRPQDSLLIRSGIEIDKFSSQNMDRDAIRKEIGVASDTPLVGMIACMKPQKSPLDFVEAAAIVNKQIPEAVFFLAGDGILRPEIEKRIDELGMRNKFRLLGWRRDVPELLAALDVMALTSLFEGLPRVIPQAMAAGKPVVATAVDGSPEAVTNGETGFLVSPKNPQSVAEKIIAILKMPDRGIAMGKRGLELVREFDIEKMVRDQEELYTKLIEKNQ